MASPLTDIPDHILAEIFLRLPDPADLARASAACVPFRRLATQASFLRAFRRLHAPLHLGILHINGFHPALPPHPSAPAARAFALEADFSFSFLPASHRRWMKLDIRDGRVLLSRATEVMVMRTQSSRSSRFATPCAAGSSCFPRYRTT
ncbi:hypothetical protein VPH35_132609 [Triticum aestivum]